MTSGGASVSVRSSEESVAKEVHKIVAFSLCIIVLRSLPWLVNLPGVVFGDTQAVWCGVTTS